MKTYSQYNQDKWLLDNLFRNKKEGFFVEIGADDGIDKSNTKLFEDIGWNGLCIEPSFNRFQLLKNNRKCICENIAVSDDERECDFLDISGYGKGLSGLIEKYEPAHKQRIQKEIQNPNNTGSEIIQVKTTTLDSLIKKHKISYIDFCSIDTEGAELEIIKGINFNYITIDAFLIENNYNDQHIPKILEQQGYKKITKLAIDDVYIKPHKFKL